MIGSKWVMAVAIVVGITFSLFGGVSTAKQVEAQTIDSAQQELLLLQMEVLLQMIKALEARIAELEAQEVSEPTPVTDTAVPPVTERDHIRGNPNAPIVIVEYSDFECPFCKSFHETMKQVMDEYGPSGEVAWVYRHFPLHQLHPNAPAIAAASECVADIGGNDAFWEFADLVYEDRDSNERTNMDNLTSYAEAAGVDWFTFEDCVQDAEFIEYVEASFDEAVAIGANGTPHSVMIVGDQTAIIQGAQPYDVVSNMIDEVLLQLEDEVQ